MQLKNIKKSKNNDHIHTCKHKKAKYIVYQPINTCKTVAALAFLRLILQAVEILCSQNIENRVLGLPSGFLFSTWLKKSSLYSHVVGSTRSWLIAFLPRTGMLEAQAKDQGHRRQGFSKKKKRVFNHSFHAISRKNDLQKNFSSGLQNFNVSKNIAVREPITGQFLRTWGFEAKDLKMCSRGRPRGLHLCYLDLLLARKCNAANLINQTFWAVSKLML